MADGEPSDRKDVDASHAHWIEDIRTRVDEARRLLTQDSAKPSAGGYPQAASNGSRAAALQELQKTTQLLDALKLRAQPRRISQTSAYSSEADPENFETQIESAPDYTREWLRSEFSEQSRAAKRDRISSSEGSHPDMSALVKSKETKQPSIRRADSKGLSGFCVGDELVQAGLKSTEVVDSLKGAGKLEFDALSFADLPQVGRRGISILGAHLERKHGLVKQMAEAGNIVDGDASGFSAAYIHFLTMIDQLYKPDAIYHGAAHAMDVMSTAMWLMDSSFMAVSTSAVDRFLVLVTAAVHDVAHPGVNNLFLTKTMDPIAIRYNDKSCLENMHVAIVFELMQKDPQANWHGMLDKAGNPSTFKYVREGLISMVLATDMAMHAKYVSLLDAMLKERDEREEGAAVDPKVLQDEHNLLLDLIVHSADITNPAKPRPNMLAWTKRVNAEFWAQGDQEKKRGLEVSPLCDRDTGRPSLPKGQIGFINFVVMPFFRSIAQVLPEAMQAVNALEDTVSFWKEMEKKEASYEDIFDGIEPAIKC